MSFLDAASWSGKLFSDGWRASSGGVRTVVEPATGADLGTVGLADPSDIERAALSASKAQPGWASTSFQERAAVLRRAGDLFLEHADEIVNWIVREGGGIPPKGQFEVGIAAEECYEAAALPAHPTGVLLPTVEPRMSLARRRPVGVVGVIAPFNFPLILGIRSVAPALALGNAVVFKPDPRTAVCGGVTIARIFEEAGLPAGVLHMVPGGADAGEALIADPAVPVISFTGSTSAGRKVGAAGASTSSASISNWAATRR